MSPANTVDGTDRGYIIPIGGAEEKFHNREILDRFMPARVGCRLLEGRPR